MRKAKRIIAFLGLFAAGVCAAQTLATAERIDAIFANAGDDAPGYAVAVVQDGKVVFEKTYGLASVEYATPFTPTTPFNTASLSKQFTGLAVSILVQQGKIALDDDVRKYVHELPEYAAGKVSVRQLLHHTSGIPDCYAVLVAAGWRWDDAFTGKDCMRTAVRQKELAFKPGTRYAYSNTEYLLLQAIVAKAGGKPFPQWTAENIFRPIGMDSTYFVDDYSKIVKNAAMPYSRGEHGFRRDLQQDSGVYMLSTLRDLSRWAIHFDRRLAAKDPVYLRMVEPGVLADGEKVPYGFGLMLGEDRGLDIVFHTGAWGGYRANIRHYPERHLSVVALNNAGDNDMNPNKVPQVAALFLGGAAGPQSKTDGLRDAPTVKPDPALLRGYAGVYRWKDDAITITFENDRLMAQYLGEDKVPTEAKSDTEFWVPAYRAPIAFSKKPGGAPVLVFRTVEGERVEPFAPAVPDSYAGAYYNEALASQYRVDAKDGTLSIHHFRRGDAALTPHPAYPDRFTGDMGSVQFVKGGDGKIDGFEFLSDNLGRLRFAKQR